MKPVAAFEMQLLGDETAHDRLPPVGVKKILARADFVMFSRRIFHLSEHLRQRPDQTVAQIIIPDGDGDGEFHDGIAFDVLKVRQRDVSR